jgi:N-methylhydantoinase A
MLGDARSRYDAAHLATYGYAEAAEPCELVNLRVAASGLVRRPELAPAAADGSAAARGGVRQVWFPVAGFVEAAILQRRSLGVGAAVEGPAVIEDQDSTTLLAPGWQCRVERYGVLAIRRSALRG